MTSKSMQKCLFCNNVQMNKLRRWSHLDFNQALRPTYVKKCLSFQSLMFISPTEMQVYPVHLTCESTQHYISMFPMSQKDWVLNKRMMVTMEE